MTEQRKGTELVPLVPGAVAIADVASVRTLAKDLIDSGLFQGVRNVAGAVTIIQAGLELGIPPVAALNTMAIIGGRLAMEAKLLLAVAHARAGVTWIVTKEGDGGCEIKFSRPGWPDHTSSFTKEEAEAARLLGKDNWRLWKKDMYFARAAGRGVRRIAPDATLGIYAREEMEDSPLDLNGKAEAPKLPPIAVDKGVYEALKAKPLPRVKDEFESDPAAEPVGKPRPEIDIMQEAEEVDEEPLVLSGEPEAEEEAAEEQAGGQRNPEGPTLQQMEKFAKVKANLQACGIPEVTLWEGIHRFTTKTYNKVAVDTGDFSTGEMDMVIGYLTRWSKAQEADKAAREKKNGKN